jgi:8-oxo-dGTP pyrophosphatase MutT (NUDIX family)
MKTATQRGIKKQNVKFTSKACGIFLLTYGFIIQKAKYCCSCAKDKDSYPGLWDISAGGHNDSGETPLESAVREMKEEIGLEVNPGQLEYIGVRIFSQPIIGSNGYENEFGYVYLYKFDGNVNDLSLPDGFWRARPDLNRRSPP